MLDREPSLQVGDTKAITDWQSANAALAGLYNQMQEVYNGRIQRLADVAGTTAQSIGSNSALRQVDTYTIDAENVVLLEIWTYIYRGVNIANNILARVPQIGFSEEQKNYLLGQTYFLRGLLFFDAVRIWGGVPNVVGESGIPLPQAPSRSVVLYERSSLQASYNQVEKDWAEAVKLLPEISPAGQANKNVVYALLSRFYLYFKNYPEVERYANAVIANPRYSLVFPYSDIFNNKNTKESIFEVQFDNIDTNTLSTFYLPSTMGGNGEIAAHTEFYNQIDRNDERARMFVRGSNGLWYSNKYTQKSANAHLIRLAEVYLNRAEARTYQNNFAGARADLNAVRGRVNALADNTANSIEQLVAAIEKERRLELCYEGFEWFDLVRTGRALVALSNVPRSNATNAQLRERYRLVFPIPAEEIKTNPKMLQNQGY
ncbi:MAG: RagB/SusD family nutrient uptake outer membrane protein [Thermoflexibacter sp.]